VLKLANHHSVALLHVRPIPHHTMQMLAIKRDAKKKTLKSRESRKMRDLSKKKEKRESRKNRDFSN
jgi:hypothetical protein